MSLDQSNLAPVWFHITDLVLERGEGTCVWDVNGTRYLDFTSGIGVTNTGHCHPRVVRAIQDQAARFIHAQVNIYYHQPLFRLAEALRRVVPARLDSFFFSNSGAEAVEAAVKLARHATGRPNVVVFQGSFHGRTAQAMAMTTSKTVYRVAYQPLPGGVFVAPFPYWYRYGWDPEQASQWALEEVRFLLQTQTAPLETAALFVEPVLGEGGYVVSPPSFLPGLREICDEHGVLLVLDEVQSGFGRTGKFFAFEHFGVEPDILVMAKGLGSGFPISGIAAPRALTEKWMVGTHGGTYGGNPMGCAAAEATVQTLLEEKLLENAAERGRQLMDGLHEIQSRYPVVGDVRGLGLMVGVEFTQPETRKPAVDIAKRVIGHCLKEGHLILMSCGPYGNTVRWIPPLVVSKAQIDEGLTIFEQAVGASVN
jgi:4-aminobutyrate aminotransferase